MDGTLLEWTCAGYPSKLSDYKLWSANCLETMRRLHADGHKLVIMTNQVETRSHLVRVDDPHLAAPTYTGWHPRCF